MNIENFKTNNWGIVIILSILFMLFAELYIVIVENFKNFSEIVSLNILSFFSIYHCILLFVLSFIFIYIWKDKDLRVRTGNFIYNNRYLLAFVFFIICVIFEIHGSSLGYWDDIIFGRPHNSLLGVVRPIRADEWRIFTPLTLSQYFSNFAYFSPIPRATLTDMFFVYGAPVWNILLIFRPFQLGYLFLSPAKGLSFYWMGRLIILFLVSFEMGMLITNKNKTLSLAYTILITFSPVVQWWFSINSLLEMLIFGQLMILLINNYMNTNNYRRRLICALVFTLSLGGLLFALYPAWQVPLGYVFLFLFIWVVWTNYKKFKHTKLDLLLIIFPFIIVGLSLVYFYLLSGETISLVRNTIYPGSRVYTGGLLNSVPNYFNYIVTILFPLNYNPVSYFSPNILNNAVNPSFIYDFFPVPLILYYVVNFVEKNKDKLLNLLFILFVLLNLFYLIPFPEFIAKLSLLSFTTPNRLFLAISLLNILILFRSMSLLKYDSLNNFLSRFRNKNLILGLISIFIAVAVFSLCYYNGVGFFDMGISIIVLLIVVGILSLSLYFIFKSNDEKYRNAFLIMCILIGLMGGALVNPVESGLTYYNHDSVKFVASVVQSNPNATWVTFDGDTGDVFIPVGARTIDSINTYPNFGMWEKIDPNYQYVDSYNRYAHIMASLVNNQDTKFVTFKDDVFNLTLNVNDLEKLNVTYVFSRKNITDLSNENVTFENLYKYKIYKVHYTDRENNTII